jgi:predicted component of type VI protein secretion system
VAAVGDPMPAQLVALTDGQNILVDKSILLIGRHPECDIQIDSRKISRRHCCLAQVSGHLVVRDLGSTNGIRINGVRVLEGRLRDGDEVTIGNSRFKVRFDGALPPAGAAVPAPAPRPPQLGDELLEGCEDPVPLAEPEGSARARGKFHVPTAVPAEPESPPIPRKNSDAPSSIILPENLNLAPASDVFPSASSPSHPPP